MFIAHGGTDHPVNLHAAHAAQAADVAEQAATVAQRVAAHTEAVAADTASALRYTQDALKRAGANTEDIAEVGKEADKMEEEAGTEKHSSSKGSLDKSESSSKHGESSHKKSSNLDSEEEDSSSSISKDDTEPDEQTNIGADGRVKSSSSDGSESASASASGDSARNLDVNSQIVPYPNSVEPFGQEQPAKELTKASVKQSDSMVDKIENAQGTESKRAVYRALTKLRGATIASYDGMAKGHLSNVDHYNKKSKWRDLHPMKHLAEEESDTHIWAFPKKSTKKKPTFADNKKLKNKAADAPAPAEPASPA